MTTKNELREKLLAASGIKNSIIRFNGVEVEIAVPSIKQRNAIIKKCVSEDGLDLEAVASKAIIEFCVVPGTDEKVFEPSDLEALLNAKPGSFADKALEEMLGFLGLSRSKDELEKK